MIPLFTSLTEIILASGSPRRRAYFEDLGLSFRVLSADIEEKLQPGESSRVYVERLAEEKARAVAAENEKSWIVGADTVVCFEEMVLEKPDDEQRALEMLMRLSGNDHVVQTAVCLFNQSLSVCEVVTVTTRVFFWDFGEKVAWAYVQSGEPLDKAGSYGIQGKGAFLVREIQGSYSNVVGLPLCELLEMLYRYKLIRS
ncbi:MAG: septum formation inhibitor Maf [Proteobacteria bacterium]|nr:septum formation inhibitor Maf [Pseudomonadota bacterium]MBU1060829.1 septum formation inhibitor Maf [Pseudomonadota bacterium]